MNLLKYFIVFSFSILLVFSACHLETNKEGQPIVPQANPVPSKQDQVTTPPESLIWSGSIEFNNSAKYRDLLRDHRKCDPCSVYRGPLECKNFDSRADVEIKFDKAELPSKATLTIKPYHSGRVSIFQGYLGVCGFTVSPTSLMSFTGTAKYANEYQGFYVRFSGDTSSYFGGSLSYVTLKSDDTNHIDYATLDVGLYYGNSVNENQSFGRATLENSEAGDRYIGGQTGGR